MQKILIVEDERDIADLVGFNLERAGYDVFSEIIRVTRPRRALIAARTWAGVMLRSLTPAAVLRA